VGFLRVEITPERSRLRGWEGFERVSMRVDECFERVDALFRAILRSRPRVFRWVLKSSIARFFFFALSPFLSLNAFFVSHRRSLFLSPIQNTVRVKGRFSVPTRTRVKARRSTVPRILPRDTVTLRAS